MKQFFSKLKEVNKTLFLGIVVLVAVITFVSYGSKSSNSLAKCPQDFTDSDEKNADFDRWAKDFYDKNPTASVVDLAKARVNYYKENNCTEAIKRFEDFTAGRVDEKTRNKFYDLANKVLLADEVLTAHSKEEFCKVNSFTAPLAQEMDFYKEVSKDDFVKYLRVALDNFLSGKYGTPTHPKTSYECYDTGLINGVQCPDGAFDEGDYSSGLSKIDQTYLKSKFIVLAVNDSAGGGKSIILLFKDKPDTVFYAWIYGYSENRGFDLRALDEYDLAKNEAPNIIETQKIFINQICSPDIGF